MHIRAKTMHGCHTEPMSKFIYISKTTSIFITPIKTSSADWVLISPVLIQQKAGPLISSQSLQVSSGGHPECQDAWNALE